MLADPQTLTVNSVDQTLPAISREPMKSVYREDVGEYEMMISHQETASRMRRVVRVNRKAISTDPFLPAQNLEVRASYYLVIDQPKAGFSIAEMKDDIAGLCSWLTASSSANTIKVLGSES